MALAGDKTDLIPYAVVCSSCTCSKPPRLPRHEPVGERYQIPPSLPWFFAVHGSSSIIGTTPS